MVLDCDAPAEAVVLADRVLLADLVRNLALNAWHAGPQDGAVHLRCTDAGECWRLTVQDTGCGIPAEALPHLTEPFYRVDKARARANGGSGVGLALCTNCRGIRHADDLCKPCGRGHDSDDFIAEGGRA